MDYITVQVAAEKWGISQRLVQKYCAQGRIAGAGKFGASWRIPADARKPEDPRKKDRVPISIQKDTLIRKEYFSNLMPILNTVFVPGYCQQYLKEMTDGPEKGIAMAEYYYFRGEPEKAVQKAELYLHSTEKSLKLSACLICAYANLSVGQIYRAKLALHELKNTLQEEKKHMTPELQAAESFVTFAATVLLHLPLPEEIPDLKEYLSVLPPGLQLFALYVQAHYRYLEGEYGKSLGIIETALALQRKEYPIASIYLHLAAVMDDINLKQLEEARKHLLAAWEIAQPDDLLEPFGEHHGLLGGMLEAVIKPEWPEDFRRMISITNRFAEGWRKIHNPLTGHDVADNLTTTEFTTAMLAARGWTNKEIGEHLKISTNTVKRHVSTVLQKLNIKQRKDLKKYLLQ